MKPFDGTVTRSWACQQFVSQLAHGSRSNGAAPELPGQPPLVVWTVWPAFLHTQARCFGRPPDIPLRQERLKNKQRRPRSHLGHKQQSSRRPRRAARVRRGHARPSVPAGRRDFVGQHLPSAPAGRRVLVDLRHLSVLRALPPLLPPGRPAGLVGQHLPRPRRAGWSW